jgi:hypothetical protein
MYMASVKQAEQSTSAGPLGGAALSAYLNQQASRPKQFYVDVKNEWGDSNTDYIINAKTDC